MSEIARAQDPAHAALTTLESVGREGREAELEARSTPEHLEHLTEMQPQRGLRSRLRGELRVHSRNGFAIRRSAIHRGQYSAYCSFVQYRCEGRFRATTVVPWRRPTSAHTDPRLVRAPHNRRQRRAR